MELFSYITPDEAKQSVRERHSVRRYTSTPIPEEIRAEIQKLLTHANEVAGIHLQLCCDEEEAFGGLIARYGGIGLKQVKNYIACVAKPDPEHKRAVGYWGEQVVLLAQAWGLNTCWVGMNYSKRKNHAQVAPGEEILVCIALGYGENAGRVRRSKPLEDLSSTSLESAPSWFIETLRASALAPTAINQQKFTIDLVHAADGVLRLTDIGGPHSGVDAGIVQANAEVGAYPQVINWVFE